MIALTKNDLQQIKDLGISIETLEDQLKKFRDGIDPIDLTGAATYNNGIIKFSDEELSEYEDLFTKNLDSIDIKRFVPASGAASRMFKSFHKYLDDHVENDEVRTFSTGFKSFAFYDEIKCKNAPDYTCAINNMINVLKLSELPKALIPFHLYTTGSRTSFEEHLVESAMILKGQNELNIHFTISEEHRHKFNELLVAKRQELEEAHNCKFNISFSYQHHSTDTVAVNPDNSLFRNEDESLLFRPGGHGSLLLNLNDLDGELVFIKNIDNVQIDHLKGATVKYKKILAGYLIQIQKLVADALVKLDENNSVAAELAHLATNHLSQSLPSEFEDLAEAEKLNYLRAVLDRPIRICGMVKNEGEPGGGPFWTRNSKGVESLQIVESSQMDLDNPTQAEIVKGATHFNPVDLVCWVKDYKGNKFDLARYTDPATAFISEKSQQGKNLKVLEHPGLWNGAMAEWITLFVEVPIETFSPVKTINDLLRPQHQPA